MGRSTKACTTGAAGRAGTPSTLHRWRGRRRRRAHTRRAARHGRRARSTTRSRARRRRLGIPTGAIAVTPNGRTVWSADTHASTITSHRSRDLRRGRSIDVGGAPTGIAISPHGDLIVVTTAFYDRPGLALVDVLTGEVDHVDVGPEPGTVVFAADGRSAYVAGGGAHGTLTRVEPGSGRVHAPIALGAHPRGLALHPDGKHALVALNGAGAVVVVALARAQGRRAASRPRPFPPSSPISPDGKRASSRHNGFGAHRRHAAGPGHRRARRPSAPASDPAGVAFAAPARGAGRRRRRRARSRCSTRTPAGRRRRVQARRRTAGVAVAGRRGIVADGRTGKLTAIRLGVLR